MGDRLFAFDIGESQVKMVWREGAACKKAVCAALPDNLVSNGEILSHDAMADFLRDIASDNGIPKKMPAAVILPDSQVFAKTVEVPLMTEAQLVYNLPYEFKDYLTQEKGNYYFDYAVQETVIDDGDDEADSDAGYADYSLDSSADDDSEPERDPEAPLKGTLKLFACATLKQTINDYREMFKRAGFKLVNAIPEEAAYVALMAADHLDESDTCIVDIGFDAIRMHFLQQDTFISRRVIDLGMRDVVAAIAENRNIDEHMAYEYMRTNYEGVLDDPDCAEIYGNMAVEIMKAVNFYNYNNRDRMLEYVHLCGGGAAVDPIADAVANVSSFKVTSAADLLPDDVQIDEPWLFVKALGCALQA